ncbi:MAG TPA: response regulator transcription factor [Burkholderiales bacterium]
MTVRILLVDDHQMVRAGLRALLGDVEGLEVAGEAASVEEAIAYAGAVRPHVVLMDLRLPDGSGVDACREILSTLPGTRVLFLTSHSDEEAVMSTVLAGASGYLLKDIGHQALVSAIRAAAAGQPVLDSTAAQPVAQRAQKVDSLSAQERRVLGLVVEGKTNKEIALALGLSDKTVKNYLSNVFQKLGVARRAQAAALFARGDLD